MNTDGTGFHTCKECHKTESLWNHTTIDNKEREQLKDRRSVCASNCNSGDGTDQRVQSLMFMVMMMMNYCTILNERCCCVLFSGFFNLCNVNSGYSCRISVILILQLLYEQRWLAWRIKLVASDRLLEWTKFEPLTHSEWVKPWNVIRCVPHLIQDGHCCGHRAWADKLNRSESL